MSRVRSQHTPSPFKTDTQWPHQVALPDNLCGLNNYVLLLQWHNDRGLELRTRQVQAVWPDRKYEDMRIHCFREHADAEAFMEHFGGRWFDPEKDREGPRASGVWRQEGEYRQMTESGPLSRNAEWM